ncbi:FliH/SctL family protein [Fluviispira multicolorata]|uniref:Flagellar assembly protein FliH n=1 Tax=Fluviispira multicolorata TaxID=2654512 RepID=A0A833N661_9BACT|nr:FliH/SctL family protein [Fluviispira multicolorata]KAB8032154.1 hypothetical protein GCL57_05775 [Fluviispira multicolorata]
MGSKTGRLVKKENTKVMNTLEIEKYPWLNFSDQSVIFPDNPRKSVILQKMHDPQEYEAKIKTARDFKKQIGTRAKIMLPTDMTLDFEKGRKEMVIRRRRTMMDEEEAMALELSEMEHQIEVKTAKKNVVKDQKSDKESLEQSKVAEGQGNNSQEMSFIPQEQPNEVKNEMKSEAQREEKTEDLEKVKEKNESIFAEAKRDGFEKGEKEGIEAGKKEGFVSGEREGFQSGEERGMAAAESKFEKAFENISEVAQQLTDLKEDILNQGKDIFVELTKLCCEKILKEQIKSNDESLAHLFDEVLKLYNSKNSLTIEMNSKDAERIRKHLETKKDSSKIEIKENDSLENGAFHVESDTGVSLVDIKKSVNVIIENIKKDLFQENNNIEKDTQKIEKKEA